MLQKRTYYHDGLNLLPPKIKNEVKRVNTCDPRQRVAYLVFLDMLQLLKM